VPQSADVFSLSSPRQPVVAQEPFELLQTGDLSSRSIVQEEDSYAIRYANDEG